MHAISPPAVRGALGLVDMPVLMSSGRFRMTRLQLFNSIRLMYGLACHLGSGAWRVQAKCGCHLEGAGARGPPQVVPPRTALDNTAASAARKTALSPGGLNPQSMHVQQHLPEALQSPVQSAGLIAACICSALKLTGQQVSTIGKLLDIMPKAADTHPTYVDVTQGR